MDQRDIQIWNDAVEACLKAAQREIDAIEAEAADGMPNPARAALRAIGQEIRPGDERRVVHGLSAEDFPAAPKVIHVAPWMFDTPMQNPVRQPHKEMDGDFRYIRDDAAGMRPTDEALERGGPVLVKFKDDLTVFGIGLSPEDHNRFLCGIYAVMVYEGPVMGWRFHGPLGRGGVATKWLAGWWALPGDEA